MRKNSGLLVLLIILAGLGFYLSQQKGKKSTIDATDRDFAIKKIEEISEIFLADRNGNQVTLRRNGNLWQVNDRWKANPNIIMNLLETLQRVSVKYIPSQAAVPNIIKDLSSHGIKVELYNKADNLIKSYYVGGVTNDESGTYMIMEGASQPYVMTMPGFDGTLRVRYVVEEEKWRDKTIFELRPNQINQVSIVYPKQQEHSFLLKKEAGQFTVSTFAEEKIAKTTSVSRGRAEQFLTGFSRLLAEGFENNNQLRDSTEQAIPFCEIKVALKNGQQRVVRLHPIFKKDSRGNVMLRENGQPLVERYFAHTDNQDFMLVQHLVFGRILWTYQAFLPVSNAEIE